MSNVPRRKEWRFKRVLTDHLFDKLWVLDISLGEFRAMLDSAAEVIEETMVDESQLKELILYLDWTRPLHVAVVIDESHEEERLVTVYEPSPDRWSDDYRTRL